MVNIFCNLIMIFLSLFYEKPIKRPEGNYFIN
jgi:hypothetical protein